MLAPIGMYICANLMRIDPVTVRRVSAEAYCLVTSPAWEIL